MAIGRFGKLVVAAVAIIVFATWHALLWLWAGARLVMDWTGRSTFAEDFEHAQGLVGRGVEWLFSTPWWVPSGLAAILTTIFAAFLIFYTFRAVRAPRSDARTPDRGRDMPIGADTTTAETSPHDEKAQEKLMTFTLEYMLPACQAQTELQDATSTRLFFNNKYLQRTVLQGIRHDEQVDAFWSSYRRLQNAFGSSPPDTVPFDELMGCVASIERGYAAFCRETYELAKSRSIDLQTDSDLEPLWREWYDLHERMVERYDAIKRNPKFDKLFRPMRPSRWREIPQAQNDQFSASRTI